MPKHEIAVELAGGKRLVFETGRMAKQASGAALVTTGDTVVLATAVTRTTLSPVDTSAAPGACLAMRPVSNVNRLPPASSTVTSCFIKSSFRMCT